VRCRAEADPQAGRGADRQRTALSTPSAAQSLAAAARTHGRATRPCQTRLHARGAAAAAGRPVHRGGESCVLEAVRGSGRHLPQRWPGALAVAQGAPEPVREGATVHAIGLGAAPEGAAPPLDSPSPALALRAARSTAPRAGVQADREGDAARADPATGGLAPGRRGAQRPESGSGRRSARAITGEPSSRVSPDTRGRNSRAPPTSLEPWARCRTMGHRNCGVEPLITKPCSANAPAMSRGRNSVNGLVLRSIRRLRPKRRLERTLTLRREG